MRIQLWKCHWRIALQTSHPCHHPKLWGEPYCHSNCISILTNFLMNWKNLRVWDQTFSEILRNSQTFPDISRPAVIISQSVIQKMLGLISDQQLHRLSEHLSYIQFSSSAVTQTMIIYQLISAQQLSSKPAFQTTSYSQTISDIFSVLVNQMSDNQTVRHFQLSSLSEYQTFSVYQ